MNAAPSFFSTLPSEKIIFPLKTSSLALLTALPCFGMTLAAGCYPALAQQSSSPDQITLPSGGSAVLPVPQPQFRGVIGRKASESTPDFSKDVTAPKGAPNVLLIMTDDTGFGAASTFGGPIATPTLDRLAKSGLTYNEFHTTALCSPTRAALLTGRNHQSVGMGNITEFATGYPPGYTVDHTQERGYCRQHSRRQRLQHGVVRQAPLGSRVDARSGRAV